MAAQRGDFGRQGGRETASAPERLSATEAWGDWFDRAMNSGAPIVDAVGDGRMDYDGPRCADDDCDTAVDNDGDRCEDCAGRCPECGAEVARPGLCFDCDVRASYVGGLAPRFGAQP